MPQYAMLLYLPAPADPTVTSPEEEEAQMDFVAKIEELGGKIVSPFALQSSTAATSVRGGIVTDGPFIESKEVVGGFFILEAPDLDHAREIAKQYPATLPGGVEMRPVFEPPEE
jgi:hypothetical protein